MASKDSQSVKKLNSIFSGIGIVNDSVMNCQPGQDVRENRSVVGSLQEYFEIDTLKASEVLGKMAY